MITPGPARSARPARPGPTRYFLFTRDPATRQCDYASALAGCQFSSPGRKLEAFCPQRFPSRQHQCHGPRRSRHVRTGPLGPGWRSRVWSEPGEVELAVPDSDPWIVQIKCGVCIPPNSFLALKFIKKRQVRPFDEALRSLIFHYYLKIKKSIENRGAE